MATRIDKSGCAPGSCGTGDHVHQKLYSCPQQKPLLKLVQLNLWLGNEGVKEWLLTVIV